MTPTKEAMEKAEEILDFSLGNDDITRAVAIELTNYQKRVEELEKETIKPLDVLMAAYKIRESHGIHPSNKKDVSTYLLAAVDLLNQAKSHLKKGVKE